MVVGSPPSCVPVAHHQLTQIGIPSPEQGRSWAPSSLVNVGYWHVEVGVQLSGFPADCGSKDVQPWPLPFTSQQKSPTSEVGLLSGLATYALPRSVFKIYPKAGLLAPGWFVIRSNLPSPQRTSGSAKARKERPYQLQWRDRAGFSPASLFGPPGAGHLRAMFSC